MDAKADLRRSTGDVASEALAGARPRRGFGACAAVFVVALAVRLLYLLEARGFPTFQIPLIDSAQYEELARALSSGGPAPSSMFLQGVFYPLFLSLMYVLSGAGAGAIVTAKIVQVVVGATTCALTCRLGQRVFDRAAGFTAGLMAAVCGPLVFYDAELLSTGWEAFWAVALMLALLAGAERPAWWRLLGLGACAGLAVLTRATFLPFALAAGAWLVWRLARAKGSVAGSAGSLSQALAGFLLITFPAAAWNHSLSGSWSILPANGTLNLYIGNNPDRCATLTARPGPAYQRLISLPASQGLTDPLDQQRFYEQQVVEYARRQPFDFAKGIGAKSIEFITSREIPNTEQIYMFRDWSWLLSALVWKAGPFGFPFGVLLPLAVAGMALSAKRVPAPMWLFLGLYPAAVVLVHVCARYRAPMIPVLSVMAGAGLIELARFAGRWTIPLTHPVADERRASRATGAVAIATAAASIVVSTIPGPFCLESVNYKAEFHELLGHRRLQRGEIDRAAQEYAAGLAIADPNQRPELERCLGHALVTLGNADEGITHLHEAVRIEPGSGEGHGLLGEALLLQGRFEEAATELQTAVRLKPDMSEAHTNLGTALFQLRRPDEAIAAVREARRLKPDEPRIAVNLGLMLLQTGRAAEAVAELKAAVALDPTQLQPCYFLGVALEAMGRPREAAEAYRALLSAFPGHEDARERLRQLESGSSTQSPPRSAPSPGEGAGAGGPR